MWPELFEPLPAGIASATEEIQRGLFDEVAGP